MVWLVLKLIARAIDDEGNMGETAFITRNFVGSLICVGFKGRRGGSALLIEAWALRLGLRQARVHGWY